MDKTIRMQLSNIEKENKVKILYAVESGSRAWGFESRDSDYDVRFIYIHPQDWYLGIFEGPDFIEIPADAVLDINGWDLRKALQLMYKSNPPLLEWLSSPISYSQEQDFVEGLRDIANYYFATVPVIYHYINLAMKSFEELKKENYIRIKKLFYVIRPVMACMFAESYNRIPPMNLQELMSKVEIDSRIKNIIDELVITKSGSMESDAINPPEELVKFIEQRLYYYTDYIKKVKNDRKREPEILNELFRKTLRDYSGGIL